jgi:hypothetical protein
MAEACGLACAFRKIVCGLTQTVQNGIQQGKQRRQQGDCSGQVVRQDMQGEFAFDRLQPTAPKTVKATTRASPLSASSNVVLC